MLRTTTERDQAMRRWLLLVFLVVLFVGFPVTNVVGSRGLALFEESAFKTLPVHFNSTPAQESGADFSKFSHVKPTHARLPCLLCHRREGNSPRPQRTGHMPCAGCHSQQFANAGSPLCTICHNDVQKGSVKPFPSLKSHNMKFNHERHVTGAGRSRQGCATCHRPERQGLSLSIPSGPSAHTTCFQCHAARAQSKGRDISSCSTCHSSGGYRRTPELARSFKVGFSHANHGVRQSLSCDECHSVRAGMSQARQVTAPVPKMHHATGNAQSCISCHNNSRAFGEGKFSDCKKCHRGKTWGM